MGWDAVEYDVNAEEKRVQLTNFPQLHSQIPIRIEPPRESPTIIQDTHEPQEMFGRYRIIHLIILE